MGIIKFDKVTQVFGELCVLKNITIQLTERRIAIIGANGSGKSTFVRLINGLQLPSQGFVSVDGLDTKRDAKAVKRKVGFVFQNPDNQIVLPLVEEDLSFGLKNLKLSKDEIKERVDEILQRYDLQAFRDHPVHLLSGGQKQLVAISSVVAMKPDYIVFDEPTTLLDLRNKLRVAQVIEELSQTAIVVSHDLEFLKKFDRVLVFERGEIAIDDVPFVAIKEYIRRMS
ncbi:energy-coupling factor ABC transporter ATP-binding protein [Bartonella krasnovii]|uniref:ATP-binding cassette domain-containing protein n=1 Tax=Bartonella krasnovii TaxID=2267275 RepID=A0A5B9CZ90_9HYPH|nr:ATP-binding cassette domain-containing protein [Bartonella krasnovii]QEE11606.1 ATP-binding cassette domain-containing protein [Bartonella krasnovii]UNF29362.1 ATP-binding cassette domain-containing protein [Bartonella krasnovii]UNF35719.1 ATP-binding cassette domain-containing protein [Bartonella krasnovii]UNF37339.1 ATP-binding cassette domain-containing protein [Bartonella krasnovii]UNF39072.1 ATP-binding cassette domain-containing protein [Bartonella krasnovii]